MMISRRNFTSLSVLAVGALMLNACSSDKSKGAIQDSSADYGLQGSGYPVVTKPLTLTFSGSKSALAPDYKGMALVQEWQKTTNITVDWQNLPDNVYQEKKNLILASGDLPDAFFNTGLSDSEVATYGTNGTLLALETLIDSHAPNLKKILDARPDIKAAITSSDGHIYTLPSVEELGLVQFPHMIAINKTWLDKLGLAVPTTIDEYHDALLAFKTADPAGGGKTIPLSYEPGTFCGDIVDLIAALGGLPDNVDHRIVQDGKVVFTAVQPQYKKAISALNSWYKEGLIDPESFSQDDKSYLAKGKTTTQSLGSFVWWEIKEMVGEDQAGDYVLVPILTGVDGKKLASVANNQEINRGAFAITRANKYPAATMRWVDYLYEPVQSAQANWGPIGVTLEKDAKGVLVQIPADASTSEGERRQKVAPGGPKVITKEDFVSVVAPEPRAAERQKIVQEMYLPHAANAAYPPVPLSNEELQQISSIETDVKSLTKQKLAKWIVQGGVEAEWDGYVSQLKSIGLDRMIETYQQAYDRFQSNS